MAEKEFQGQGVYPSELRTDPRGIEIYQNCVELADCEGSFDQPHPFWFKTGPDGFI